MTKEFNKDAAEIYQSGKESHYKLLFAVNGGAFAIAKLLTGTPEDPGIVLGGLHLWQLSLGMILFTAIMVWDTFMFGLKMRDYLPDVFETPGRVVLLCVGALLCLGWFLVGFRFCFQ